VFYSTPTLSRAQVEEMFEKLERTRIEREIALNEAIERRNRAYELARDRSAFLYEASGGGLVSASSIAVSRHTKNPAFMILIFPIATYLVYKANICYGGKREYIAAATADLMKYDADLLSVAPIGPDDIKRRMKELQVLRSEAD
ncbi:hypothetical protein PMAYCL1PPCAC_05383, partial [Pristionchus mayeri]